MAIGDLVDIAYAQSRLPGLETEQASDLPQLITAASKLFARWTRTRFEELTCDEVGWPYDNGDLFLRHKPILSIDRVRIHKNTLITIRNASSTGQYRVRTVDAGDLDVGLVTSGLELISTIAGVRSAQTVAFADNPTIAELADSINAIGDGWSASYGESYGDWPCDEILPMSGPLRCDQGDGAEIQGMTEDLDDYDLDYKLGVITTTYYINSYDGYPRAAPHRVRYSAGYDAVPEDVQEAAIGLISWMLASPDTAAGLKKHDLGERSIEFRDAADLGIPKSVMSIASLYRSYGP